MVPGDRVAPDHADNAGHNSKFGMPECLLVAAARLKQHAWAQPGSMPSHADMDREVAVNFDLVSHDPLTEEDIITSPKKLAALGNMNESLVRVGLNYSNRSTRAKLIFLMQRWLRSRLGALHHADPQVPAQANGSVDGPDRSLPLTAEMQSCAS